MRAPWPLHPGESCLPADTPPQGARVSPSQAKPTHHFMPNQENRQKAEERPIRPPLRPAAGPQAGGLGFTWGLFSTTFNGLADDEMQRSELETAAEIARDMKLLYKNICCLQNICKKS